MLSVEVSIRGALPLGFVYGVSIASVSILSEDIAPFSVSVSSVTVSEGASVTLTLAGASGVYTYAVSGSITDGDISGINLSGVFTVPARGETIVVFTATDDNFTEDAETVEITVTNPDGATLSVSTVISASDPLSVSVSDADDVTEVSSVFSITLSGGEPTLDVMVTYRKTLLRRVVRITYLLLVELLRLGLGVIV